MGISTWKVVLFALTIVAAAYALFPQSKQLSEMYMGNFEYDKAEPLLYGAHESNPNDTRALKNLARYFGIQGNQKKQIEVYEKLIKILPENVEFRYELAQLYRWHNRPLEELAQLETVERLTPNDPRLLTRLIDFYQWQKNPEKAVYIMKQLIEAEPNKPEHYIRLAEDYLRLQKYDDAIRVYEKLTKNYKSDIQYHLELADLYEWQKKFDKGVKLLYEVLALKWGRKVKPLPNIKLPAKLDSQDREIFERLGILFLNLKQNQSIVTLYQKILEIEPNNQTTREDLAGFYRWMDQPEKSIEAYLSLAKDFPTSLLYLTEIGDIYVSQGQLPEAENHLLQALGIDPFYTPAIVALSQVYIYMEKPKKAIPLILAVLKKRKEDPTMLKALAEAYFYSGYHKKAIAIYEKLLKSDSENEDFIQNVADAYLYSGQPKSAIPFYKKLIKLQPDKKIHITRLGESHILSGEHKEGIEILERYIKRYPKDAQVSFILAQAYQQMGRTLEATRYYKQTISIVNTYEGEELARPVERTPQNLKQKEAFEKKKAAHIFSNQMLKAKAHVQLNQQSQALRLFEKLYKEHTGEKQVLLAYVDTLIEFHYFEKAYDLLYPHSLQSDEPEITKMMASLFDEAQDPYTASLYHEEALKMDADDFLTRFILTQDYDDIHRPMDAWSIAQSLVQEHPVNNGVRGAYERLSLANAPHIKSYYYNSHLKSDEITRYQHTNLQLQLTNRFRFLGDFRFGHYSYRGKSYLGDESDDDIASADMGAQYEWGDSAETSLQVTQSFNAPKNIMGLHFLHDFFLFPNKDYEITLSTETKLRQLWLVPVRTIPFEGVQDSYSFTYSQDLFRKYVKLRATAARYDSRLNNGGRGIERTFEGSVGLRLSKMNPKLIVSYRYFRDSPTTSTLFDPNLRLVTALNPLTQHHYIADLQYELPNKLLLVGATTWSGHKDQDDANLFRGTESLIGWSAGLIWPAAKQFKMTLNYGNSAAGSEGGVADADATVYFGQLEYWFF